MLKMRASFWMSVLALSMLAAASLACDIGATPEPPTPTPLPPPTETPLPPTETPVPLFTLTVLNQSGFEICTLTVAPASSDASVDDQLGQGTLLSGGSFELTDVPAGSYDLRAEACDSDAVIELPGADLTEGDLEWTLAPIPPYLVVINNSEFAVCEVYYIEHSNPSPNYGPNRLEEPDRIEPGESWVFFGFGADEGYDMFAYTCAGGVSWDAPNTRVNETTWELLDNRQFEIREGQ